MPSPSPANLRGVAAPTKPITINVPLPVHQRLGALAASANLPLSGYAQQLLLAAYSARVKPPSGDRDLDAQVARVAICCAGKLNTAEIAEAVRLSEPAVVRILDAWRAEVLGRAA